MVKMTESYWEIWLFWRKKGITKKKIENQRAT
jgi:hypothetical protein